MTTIRYISEFGTHLVRRRGDDGESSGAEQKLLGARLHVDPADIQQGMIAAQDLHGHTGFVPEASLSSTQQLKIFYVDVGQGDGTLIEAEGAVLIIDGGPNRFFFESVEERFADLQQADVAARLPPRADIRVNAMIVSHFDLDHYWGLIRILKSPHYRIGTLYHNGLPRYGDDDDMDLDLGTVHDNPGGLDSISVDLTDLASAQALLDAGMLRAPAGGPNKFAQFLQAALDAHAAGRLDQMAVLGRHDMNAAAPILPDTGPELRFEVLGPVTIDGSGGALLPAFPNPHDVSPGNPHPSPSASHTINGNSVVLRLVHGDNSFLFGGDLNQPAQRYLEERYQGLAPFSSDVNKACHHGSSDFDLPYLRAVEPHATIFSSGDSGQHDHPLPDAMGAAAKHSFGDFPLVFSTELTRATSKSGTIKRGDINARSNGRSVVMAQKKEKPSTKKTWHAFPLPYAGPFGAGH